MRGCDILVCCGNWLVRLLGVVGMDCGGIGR